MISTITGDNSFMRRLKLKELIADFTNTHDAVAIERLDGEETSMDRLTESLTAFSLFSSDKLVILRQPSAQRLFTENTKTILKSVPDTTQVVIIELRLDKRTGYYKILKSNTNFIQCDQLSLPQLIRWITDETTYQNGVISIASVQYLVDRIGNDQELLYNELQKLLAHNLSVSKDTIDALTEQSSQSTIFELIDAAFAGNTQRALRLYHDQRQQKVEPLTIVGMLAWQLYNLAIVKVAKNTSEADIARAASLNPFVVRKSRGIAGRISISQLKALIQQLLNIDIKLKSTSLNADDALTQFILELSEG